MKKLIVLLAITIISQTIFSQNTFKYVINANSGIMLPSGNLQTTLDSKSYEVTVAATNASAAEKAQADYICDGTNDEVQWALANTAAAGGRVKLLGANFTIQNNIILTSNFVGVSVYKTSVNVADDKQITLHYPGNISNLWIYCDARTTMKPVVQLESIDGTPIYVNCFDLLDNVKFSVGVKGGVALRLYTESVNNWQYISFCSFGDIYIYNFFTGVELKSVRGTAESFVNSNTFESFTVSADTMMAFEVIGTGEAASNNFSSIHMQYAATTDVGIDFRTARTGNNNFAMVDAMDFPPGGAPSIKFPAVAVIGNYARGILPNISWGHLNNARENNVLNTSGLGMVDGGTLTVASNTVHVTGEGEYLIAGEGGASDDISVLHGCKRGQRVILRRATAGQTITVTTYLGIDRNVVLSDAKDYVELFCTANGVYTLVNYSRPYGPTIGGARKTIGRPGATGCDFTFSSAANSTAQNIDLGGIVPSQARIIGIEIICTEVLHSTAGASDITMRAGNASAGEQFISSLSCDDLREVVGIIDATKPAVVPMVVNQFNYKSNIFIGGDPDQNWDTIDTGKWQVFVTYIEYSDSVMH